MNLDKFDNSSFKRGKTIFVELLWISIQALFINSWQPSSRIRITILRLFGAKIGCGVVIKPHVRIKFPWKLTVGDFSWIGESVWIDNLADVTIGNNCCISQGVYFCTGSHNWKSHNFDLIVKPISIKDKVWICSSSVIGPGTLIAKGSIVTMGSIATGSLCEWTVFGGNPVQEIRKRTVID